AGDSVVFANFRNDRAKELTSAISQADFDHFKTRQISNLTFVTLTRYDQGFKNVQVMFDPQKDYACLGEILSKNKKRQLRLAETTKFAHVTYFFNAGKKEPFKNEDRILIETKKTKEFDKFPEMRAKEITAKLVENIKSKKYDFILTNLSNADMVGHTANLGATILAVECIDICLKKIYKACCDASADLLICADHGNADKLLDFRKKKLTSHSKSKVPCILISNNFRNIKLAKNKKLANVAPTVLKLLNIPNAFEEEPLF
ncbi:MAG: 2,3-bisphosphoglycerate-independent phosphoglycerate mutase, partial [Clostridia bacterium]